MPECTSEFTKWYALTVRYQHERQTEKALQSKGLETLVPLYRSARQWSDRVKSVDLPLFAGYVLCRFALARRTFALTRSHTPDLARRLDMPASSAASSSCSLRSSSIMRRSAARSTSLAEG